MVSNSGSLLNEVVSKKVMLQAVESWVALSFQVIFLQFDFLFLNKSQQCNMSTVVVLLK